MNELCQTVLVPIANPAEYFGLNYDYGLELLLDAAGYLVHTYGRSQETVAIDLIMQVSRTHPPRDA